MVVLIVQEAHQEVLEEDVQNQEEVVQNQEAHQEEKVIIPQ